MPHLWLQQSWLNRIATIVVGIATILFFATIVVGVATFVVDCDNCEHCDYCDHIRPRQSSISLWLPPTKLTHWRNQLTPRLKKSTIIKDSYKESCHLISTHKSKSASWWNRDLHGVTKVRSIGKGCRQGGILSPLLWSLVMDGLISILKNHNIWCLVMQAI